MRELNFFENYIEKHEFTIDKRLVFYSLSMLLAIVLAFYTLFNQIKIRSLSRDIAKLQLTIEDERINKKIDEIKEKEKEVEEFNESLAKIKSLDQVIEEENVIDSYFLDNITSRMPEDIFFTSISIYTDNIQVVGNSRDRWSIAQFGKNLETIEDFREIFISNIFSAEGYYNFVLNINLKDVSIDEGESIDEETEAEEADEE